MTSPEFWSTDSLLVTVNGPEGQSTFVIEKPYARVGSHASSEVVLSGPGVEARTLYLHATAEGIFCIRLQATVQGGIGAGTWLKGNEGLRVGPYELHVRMQRQLTSPPPQVGLTAWGSAPPPLPVCEISSDEKVIDKRRFRARLNLVGRRRELALQLLGQQVSSCHCALFWDSGKLWCIDLLASNGTLLNGQSIECAEVQIDDSLSIGEFFVTFKRLSRSTPRQSSWRTGDSDEELPVSAEEASKDDVSADVPHQTILVATGDTQEAAPGREKFPPVPDLQPQQAPGTELIASPQTIQSPLQVPQELIASSQQLIEQRRQLDQQWKQAQEEVAAQVSLLQTESALLAAQRQEMARLRAEFEVRRLAMSEDLLALQQQRPSHAEPEPRLPQEFNLLSQQSSSQVESSPLEEFESLNLPTGDQSESDTSRHVPASPSSTRTIVEASYLVEQVQNVISAPLHSLQTHPPARISENPPANQNQMLPPTMSGHMHDRALESLTAAPAVAPAGISGGESSRAVGRKGRVEADELEDFMADRLTQRTPPHRLWLRILWVVAAVAILVALAGLGYAIRSQLLRSQEMPKSSLRLELLPESFGVGKLALQDGPGSSESMHVPRSISRNFKHGLPIPAGKALQHIG